LLKLCTDTYEGDQLCTEGGLACSRPVSLGAALS